MSYEPHKALSDLARPSASLFRLSGGVVLFVVLFIAIIMLFNRLQWMFIPPDRHDTWAYDLETATTPASMLVNLYAFGFMIVTLALVMRLVHQRSWVTVLGTPSKTIRQFLSVAKLLLVLHVLVVFLPAPAGLERSWNMSLGPWLAYLPLTVLGVLVQSGSEEVIFRGYLQSQLAARFKSPMVWIVLPSVLFGLLHFNPSVDETAAWIMVFWATCFGLVAADLTARSGTLGPALALHLVNNVAVMALVAPQGDFDGAALFTVPFDPSNTQLMMTWMPVEFLILLCGWLAARIACRV